MKIKITSFRGHHEADIMEPEVAEALFDKLTGKTKEALPADLKTKVPDTFEELQGLWQKGKLPYVAAVKKGNAEARIVKEFDPEADDMLFLAPIIGG